jgi:hypothetical protein
LPHTVLEVNGPDCVAEEFDGEIVALNMETGTYFSIKDNAASLWHDLVKGHSVEALVAAAGKGTPMGAAIEAFAAAIVDGGLMRPTQAARGPEGSPSVALDGALPAVEAFNDMQSLLLLAPVHEVDDQQGWPKVKDD